ncbi:hypothetical protein [Paenibacillus senegalensis]|uniref:hypothetical protein n=1 Tax=Paenibacillus senegalensis TaxID=1465766 RepID=UPI00028853A7|nr:hypothetical protein [Paenibacillus senegalensis]
MMNNPVLAVTFHANQKADFRISKLILSDVVRKASNDVHAMMNNPVLAVTFHANQKADFRISKLILSDVVRKAQEQDSEKNLMILMCMSIRNAPSKHDKKIGGKP